jgi:hypothetical protein
MCINLEEIYDVKDFIICQDPIYCPKFLFYFDCAFVTRIFKNGLGEAYNLFEGKYY